ncbi:S-adenosyl-L-methionine-dependent methyltransferase [Calycina marina]|uniref:S-adenosyl-L-methionine-dependent methyltransferase n=1 Tax=Calycina marina TaxID=1763456 RepID=A0A9P8CE46_9HELO|nr:S-adenosyl-L-methionine-dependent methyltransferase [Calycina marina]
MTSLPNDSAVSIAATTSQTLHPHMSITLNDIDDISQTPSIPPSSHAPSSAIVGFAGESADADAALQAEGEIEAEPGSDTQSYSDGESGYGSDFGGTSSISLSSSVRDFAFENGRRYHRFREGSYNFPNDDSEQEYVSREDMKHAMMVNLCQRLHFAPIDTGVQNILDIGTGTGIWAIEMGDLYPGSTILGVDLSPIQPEWVPPNVRFMVDDVESPWLRPLDHFDYIHARHTVMAIRDWPKLMGRALEHLKPGGWFELQEIHHYPYCHDGSMPENHPVTEYWSLVIQALAVLGVDFNATLLLAGMMRDAGFVNVTTRIFHVPIGTWPKNKVLKMVGLYWRTILEIGLQPIAIGPLTRGLGWSREQVEVWLMEVRKAYKDKWVHSHMPLHIICGQKPGPGVIERYNS